MERAKGLLVVTVAALLLALVVIVVGAYFVADFFDTSDEHRSAAFDRLDQGL